MMPGYTYRPGPQEVAEALSERIIHLYDDASSYPFSIALSGGSTPKVLFDYWRAHPEVLQERDIHFWWVDERMVPVESKDSNFGNALRAVFDPIGYDPEKLHPIAYVEGQSIDEAVAKYNAEVEAFKKEYAKPEPFDLVILGVGEDGHTSSLFPGQELYDIDKDFLRSVHPVNGIERVALSYEGIRRAPKCIFHVTGASKTDRLAEVISLAVGKTSDIETRRLPAAYAMRIAQKPEIFTDIKLPTSRKRGLSSHLLSGILNPSLLWLSVLPILLAESEGFGLWGLTPHLCAAGLLILFAVIQSLFRINYRSLYAHLPLLLLIPFHKVILVRLMEGMMSLSGDYSTPLLFGLIVVASIWGISSIRTCELSKHPTCRELLFSHRLMGAVAALYLPLYIVLSGHTWMDGVLPALLIVSVWATHTLRILGRARRRARTTIPTCIESRQEVRVAIIRGQEVWLTPNPCTDREECRDYDLPFSTFIRSGEDRQTALDRLKKRLPKGHNPKFLLRYNSDDNDGGHVVYLYVINLGTECPPPEVTVGGEFWCARRINEEINKGMLSPVFKEEYQYLKHTILLANSIVSKRKCGA